MNIIGKEFGDIDGRLYTNFDVAEKEVYKKVIELYVKEDSNIMFYICDDAYDICGQKLKDTLALYVYHEIGHFVNRILYERCLY